MFALLHRRRASARTSSNGHTPERAAAVQWQVVGRVTWQAAWPACADARGTDWPAKSGAALAGQAWRNPFLDRPVSADGQEKVAMDVGSERWAEPFPRTGGRQSTC